MRKRNTAGHRIRPAGGLKQNVTVRVSLATMNGPGCIKICCIGGSRSADSGSAVQVSLTARCVRSIVRV